MRTPEEYARDYRGEPDKALAARLVDLGKQLNFELIDIAEEDEERSLRIEHYLEVIRAWQKEKTDRPFDDS